MRELWAVTSLTYLKLRRDRIFFPALLSGIALIAFAILASFWGVEEFFKFIFDFGTFGFHMVGTVVALFWGTKIVSDARRDGSVEIHLAAPVGRATWILGNFLGLALALVSLGALLTAFWQVCMLLFGYELMTTDQFLVFPFLILGWVVMGAVAVFFATFTSSAVALFCGFAMWMAGLLSFPVLQALSPETPASTRKIVEAIATFWNLKQFSLAEMTTVQGFIPPENLAFRGLYGLALIAVFVVAACILFRSRDVVS